MGSFYYLLVFSEWDTAEGEGWVTILCTRIIIRRSWEWTGDDYGGDSISFIRSVELRWPTRLARKRADDVFGKVLLKQARGQCKRDPPKLAALRMNQAGPVATIYHLVPRFPIRPSGTRWRRRHHQPTGQTPDEVGPSVPEDAVKQIYQGLRTMQDGERARRWGTGKTN